MILPHIAAHLYGTPLLIHRSKLDTILSVLGKRIGLSTGSVEQPPENIPAPQPSATDSAPDIAVIPIYGTLVRRTLGLEAQSGLVSYGDIGAQIAAALEDPDISAILLDVDSSGGEAGGAFDLADAIYASRGTKPIWAVANDSCFSAAYAIASAADRVFVTRTGGVGSIGVIALHVDQSAADAQDGLTYTAVYAGARKNDLSPHAPLADAAKTSLQSEVNRIYDMFTQTVARNRNCSASYLTATDAALFFGSDAVTAGLADGVASFCEVLSNFIQTVSSPPVVSPEIPSSFKESVMQQEVSTPPQAESSPVLQATSAATPVSPPPTPYSQAVEIAQLCQIAGLPDKTAEFLASGQTVAQVRQALLSARAATPAISSHIDPLAGSQKPDLLMRVMKQHLGKE